MKNRGAVVTAVLIFVSLLIFPEAASDGARYGLNICAEVIIPALFPFFVATNFISELGIMRYIGKAMSPFSSRLFKVSGNGGTAFIIGVTGGYPLGAGYIANLRRNNEICSDEASRLLVFCNNSGPAFIIGAVGVGVFHSSAAGILLYAAHILSAAIYGVLFSKTDFTGAETAISAEKHSPVSLALTNAVKNSVSASISVCGFVVAFSILTGILDVCGVFTQLAGLISAKLCTELHWSRALISGIFELGNGIGAMSGLDITPLNLALAAFLLGWGGISVHFQSFSMISGTDIKTARYIIGRFFIALTGAVIALLSAAILC